jgi:hypothetical protein
MPSMWFQILSLHSGATPKDRSSSEFARGAISLRTSAERAFAYGYSVARLRRVAPCRAVRLYRRPRHCRVALARSSHTRTAHSRPELPRAGLCRVADPRARGSSRAQAPPCAAARTARAGPCGQPAATARAESALRPAGLRPRRRASRPRPAGGGVMGALSESDSEPAHG